MRAPSPALARAASAPGADPFAVAAIGAVIFACLILQRFGVPITETSKLNLVTPIVAGIVGLGLVTGRARFAPVRLAIFCCLAAWAVIGYAYTTQIGRQGGVRASLPSLLHFLILYLPFTLTLRGPLSREQVFRLFQLGATTVAVAGILQFFAQFAGIQVISFLPWMPEDFSVEPIFNVDILIGNTSLYKSNGFFLVEPSILSQMMAMAIMIELVIFKRFMNLTLFGLALVLSVSGTGIMVLAVFGLCVLTRSDVLSPRMIGLGLAAAVVIAVVAFVALEDVGHALINRAGEVGQEKTSGYLRFVTPFLALDAVFDRYATVGIFGIGPGSSEKLDLGFSYSLHAPWKILIEFGVPGMLAWLALVVVACWRRGEQPLVLPSLFMFLFTGGYQQFGPMIFLLFALFAFPPAAPATRMALGRQGAGRERDRGRPTSASSPGHATRGERWTTSADGARPHIRRNDD